MNKIIIRVVGTALMLLAYYLFVLGEPDTYQAFCNLLLVSLGEVGVFELRA